MLSSFTEEIRDYGYGDQRRDGACSSHRRHRGGSPAESGVIETEVLWAVKGQRQVMNISINCKLDHLSFFFFSFYHSTLDK